MIRMYLALFITLAAPQALKAPWDSLVGAERAFARMSIEKGMRDAFLANLNDESILFRPGPVPGKAFTETSAPTSQQLSWEPEFADIAASGDLGYTTGPWEIRRTPQEAPSGFGHYVTVWKKQPDGAWKIAIDIGVSHAASPKPTKVDSPKLPTDVAKRRTDAEIRSARESLLAAERQPGNPLTAAARVFRNEGVPSSGIRKVVDANVSGSADFGYAYGTIDKSNYLRIWKRERGQWKIVLDLIS